MQAENAVDQMDWMEKITGVIASLLSVQTLVHHISFLFAFSLHIHSITDINECLA